MPIPPGDVTRLLVDWTSGDPFAADCAPVLEEAPGRLAALGARELRALELRPFGRPGVEETAMALDTWPRTAGGGSE
jgi:hypothetical protein